MKIAILGPVTKDYIEIDGRRLEPQIGGIPYYIAVALQSLGAGEVAPYISCGQEDRDWVKENFPGLAVKLLPAGKTLESYIKYSSANPDIREHAISCYPNTIEATPNLVKELENYDYIIFGPLFHDNIPFDLFEKLKHKNLVLGNFGLFTYGENGQCICRHPENLIKVLPFLKYLFLDRNEAAYVSGQETIEGSARYLQEKGLSNIVITDGSQGSHLFLEQNYYQIPAFPPEVLADTTGAGDTYEAAFIRSLELFDKPEEQGRFAAMVATIGLEEKGAFRKNIEEVRSRLKKIKI